MLYWHSKTGEALPLAVTIATTLFVAGVVGFGISYFFYNRSS